MQRAVVISIGLLLTACAGPLADGGGWHALPAIGVGAATAELIIQVRVDEPSGTDYRVRFIRRLDWTEATITLSNADPTIPPQTNTVSAQVGANGNRIALFTFAPIKPTSGYTLSLSLLRPDSDGTPRVVASGANPGFTIAAGANVATVSLVPTASGELSISVPQPRVVAPLKGNVATLAGTGASGSVDGSVNVATFNSPKGVTVDDSDRVFVSEFGSHNVRRIDTTLVPTSAGYVTRVAGVSAAGYLDGPQATALFNNPYGLVAIDSVLYVADKSNNAIRKIDRAVSPTSNSYVTTLAGNGTSGSADGPLASARLNGPKGVTATRTGQIFVADTGNHRIRKIDTTVAPTSAGYVTTLAGNGTAATVNGTGTAAAIHTPYAITLAPDGNLYVTEGGGSCSIRRVTMAGVVTTVAGSSSGYLDGSGPTAKFSTAKGVAFSLGRLYIGDFGNACIRSISLNLSPSASNYVGTIAGGTAGFLDAANTTARFSDPYAVASNSQGWLYVADRGNHRVRRIQ